MHTRTIELLTYLDEQRALLRGAFEEVPAASRQRAPAPGRWSAVEVIEHVGLVERLIAQRLAEAIASARADHVGPEQATEPVLPTFTAHLTRLLDRTTTIEAPPAVRPTGLTAEAAWRALEEAGASVREALTAGDGLALGTRTMPQRILGEMPLSYFFAFIGAHEARHAAQLLEIAAVFSSAEPFSAGSHDRAALS
jgi:hypothetical protein